ncbi:hypothetical protein DFH08DRAFT_818606 [Mycena albidolilacea]|uniref:Uncharacterized protein n=1 Tax=Mycena albidolilacea TaxID=1033008 RepID=A0AAD6ZGM2_9AGAR|nr:hypothetical protein DFH08DRAFT_818606 [Mycena albidolilacea]
MFFLTLVHLAAISLHWQHPHLFSPSHVISSPGTQREMRAEPPPSHSLMANHRSTIPRSHDRIESAPRVRKRPGGREGWIRPVEVQLIGVRREGKGAREWKPGWAMMPAAHAVEFEERQEGMEKTFTSVSKQDDPNTCTRCVADQGKLANAPGTKKARRGWKTVMWGGLFFNDDPMYYYSMHGVVVAWVVAIPRLGIYVADPPRGFDSS